MQGERRILIPTNHSNPMRRFDHGEELLHNTYA